MELLPRERCNLYAAEMSFAKPKRLIIINGGIIFIILRHDKHGRWWNQTSQQNQTQKDRLKDPHLDRGALWYQPGQTDQNDKTADPKHGIRYNLETLRMCACVACALCACAPARACVCSVCTTMCSVCLCLFVCTSGVCKCAKNDFTQRERGSSEAERARERWRVCFI